MRDPLLCTLICVVYVAACSPPPPIVDRGQKIIVAGAARGVAFGECSVALQRLVAERIAAGRGEELAPMRTYAECTLGAEARFFEDIGLTKMDLFYDYATQQRALVEIYEQTEMPIPQFLERQRKLRGDLAKSIVSTEADIKGFYADLNQLATRVTLGLGCADDPPQVSCTTTLDLGFSDDLFAQSRSTNPSTPERPPASKAR